MKSRSIRVYRSRKNKDFPMIELQGKWLKEIGYNIGDYLSIREDNGKIIISIQKKFNQEEER